MALLCPKLSLVTFTEADGVFPLEGKFKIQIEFTFTVGEIRWRTPINPTRIDPPEGHKIHDWYFVGGKIGEHNPMRFRCTDEKICAFLKRAFENTVVNALYDNINKMIEMERDEYTPE